MKPQRILLITLFALTPLIWAQTVSKQPNATGRHAAPLRADRCREMIEAHKQQTDAMQADLDKIKASLAQMKANLLTITTRNELDRWRNNVDMWDVMVAHMDRMLKQMEATEPGEGCPDSAPRQK